MHIKTRFPPSPTGNLHLGGVRTALYSWLLARKHQGTFILRIEDTDTIRSAEQYTQTILQAIAWLGLDFSGEPLYQSKRMRIYHQFAQQMLQHGTAYKCYCSKTRLTRLREQQIAAKEKPRYDGYCEIHASEYEHLHHDHEQHPCVIRFRNPKTGAVTFHDLIHGNITTANSELDDMILVRSDGMPTYNFSAVIDDMTMGITHVLRGDDHINNTPRQINLYRALGKEPPVFGHLGMILGTDGKRLSKRHGALNILEYRDQGYLPEALLCYLARLGWSHGDQEIFTREELIQHFDPAHIHKSAAAFDPQKLLWTNHAFIKKISATTLMYAVQPFLASILSEETIAELQQNGRLASAIELVQERGRTLVELADHLGYLLQDHVTYTTEVTTKQLIPQHRDTLILFRHKIARIEEANWNADHIKTAIAATIHELGIKMPRLGQPLRAALTGRSQAPSVDAILIFLGKKNALARIEQAVNFMNQIYRST